MKLLFALLFATSVTHAGPAPKPPVCKQADALCWTKVGTVSNVTYNYTPVVALDATHTRTYSNSNGVADGNLYLRSCSWTSCGPAAEVLHISAPSDTYIRTLGVARGTSGTYYAVTYTGDGYPTQGGYTPSWATSPDGVTWTWWGSIQNFWRYQSSGMNLIVDESRNDGYRFMFWTDRNGGLVLMHSDTGMPADWQSDDTNMWPFPEQPQFVSAVRTPYGYHLIGANIYPATALRHVFSCTGLPPWHVLETASDVINITVGKGTNLAYDLSTNLIHALTSGVHWTLPAKAFPC